MRYKGFEIPDVEIDKLTDTLDISIAEACEMWLSDHDVIEDETVKELTEKAAKNRVTATIHQAKGEKKTRKAREKKENPLKRAIIDAIFIGIKSLNETYSIINGISTDNKNIIIRNNEKYIDFTLGDREFTINLVEHRKKKGE